MILSIKSDIHVTYTRHPCTNKTFVGKQEFTSAILTSECAAKNAVPIALGEMIADFAYETPMWKDELLKHIPQLTTPSENNKLLPLQSTEGLALYSQWFVLYQMRWVHVKKKQKSDLDEQMLRIGNTLEHIATLLESNCWTIGNYYQTKREDTRNVVSMVFSGISRQSTGNVLDIMRVYVSDRFLARRFEVI